MSIQFHYINKLLRCQSVGEYRIRLQFAPSQTRVYRSVRPKIPDHQMTSLNSLTRDIWPDPGLNPTWAADSFTLKVPLWHRTQSGRRQRQVAHLLHLHGCCRIDRPGGFPFRDWSLPLRPPSGAVSDWHRQSQILKLPCLFCGPTTVAAFATNIAASARILQRLATAVVVAATVFVWSTARPPSTTAQTLSKLFAAGFPKINTALIRRRAES